mmetsp:Transcript_23041/g.69270  ORF Transcript_23041/g.69270 Transcript_23041/m.69270 type:complete len:287 (+) Transcript_23041:245-1105(+)
MGRLLRHAQHCSLLPEEGCTNGKGTAPKGSGVCGHPGHGGGTAGRIKCFRRRSIRPRALEGDLASAGTSASGCVAARSRRAAIRAERLRSPMDTGAATLASAATPASPAAASPGHSATSPTADARAAPASSAAASLGDLGSSLTATARASRVVGDPAAYGAGGVSPAAASAASAGAGDAGAAGSALASSSCNPCFPSEHAGLSSAASSDACDVTCCGTAAGPPSSHSESPSSGKATSAKTMDKKAPTTGTLIAFPAKTRASDSARQRKSKLSTGKPCSASISFPTR